MLWLFLFFTVYYFCCSVFLFDLHHNFTDLQNILILAPIKNISKYILTKTCGHFSKLQRHSSRGQRPIFGALDSDLCYSWSLLICSQVRVLTLKKKRAVHKASVILFRVCPECRFTNMQAGRFLSKSSSNSDDSAFFWMSDKRRHGGEAFENCSTLSTLSFRYTQLHLTCTHEHIHSAFRAGM